MTNDEDVTALAEAVGVIGEEEKQEPLALQVLKVAGIVLASWVWLVTMLLVLPEGGVIA